MDKWTTNNTWYLLDKLNNEFYYNVINNISDNLRDDIDNIVLILEIRYIKNNIYGRFDRSNLINIEDAIFLKMDEYF
jgi:hypothetical protein